jgi:hypothetical protein
MDKSPTILLAAIMAISLTSCSGNSGSGTSASQTGGQPKLLRSLNDTGADYCRDAGGELVDCTTSLPQDGNAGRDYQAAANTLNNALNNTLNKVGSGPVGFDWTKLDSAGRALAYQTQTWLTEGNEADGTTWSCIKDNHTGLLWEVKTDSAESLHYRALRYAWFNPDNDTNGGEPGLQNSDDCNGSACNTLAFVAALNAKVHCGSQRWRMPTVNELMTLVVARNLDLVMDRAYFPNANNDQYWSSQTYVPVRTRAWYLYFSDGSTGSTLKEAPNYLRLVADQETP